jgi:hypothetical protein
MDDISTLTMGEILAIKQALCITACNAWAVQQAVLMGNAAISAGGQSATVQQVLRVVPWSLDLWAKDLGISDGYEGIVNPVIAPPIIAGNAAILANTTTNTANATG